MPLQLLPNRGKLLIKDAPRIIGSRLRPFERVGTHRSSTRTSRQG